MGHIRLRGMRFYGYHGALEAERAVGQRFVIDLEMALDLQAAGTSDDLTRTVHYGHVFDHVREIVEGQPAALIEAVAERIAARVLDVYSAVVAVRVCVHKPGAPVAGIVDDVEVEIVRARA